MLIYRATENQEDFTNEFISQGHISASLDFNETGMINVNNSLLTDLLSHLEKELCF